MTPKTPSHMLILLSGPGSCSAPYHWATGDGNPVCGKRTGTRWTICLVSDTQLAAAKARGQALCPDCATGTVIGSAKRAAKRQAELARLAAWNAAAGQP